MAREYQKIMNVKVFPNEQGKARWGNGKFTPWKDGAPADVHLRGDVTYSVRVFEEADGSLGISFTQPVGEAARGTDSLSADLQQGGMKKLADTVAVKSGLSLDDEIPF
jgi:hypothetical protein